MTQYRLREEIPENIRIELEGYHPIVQKLLFYRGIDNRESAELFFSFDNRQVHDFSLLKDIDKAVDRIVSAIKSNQKIVVYSDYDADGIPGAVILNDFFKEISYQNVEIYIPHRNKEGFGLNSSAIESFAENKVDLVITIDCGSADAEHVKRANQLGIDVIVTDHHEVGEVLPPAYAIINPKQKDCSYPEKMLCGSAVIFKVVQALIAHKDIHVRDHFDKSLLDMVGIATLSDMVPLIGENRLFAHYGLLVLRNSPRLGISLLCKKGRVEQKKLTPQDVVFTITPRINAASRMDVPDDAFNLLSSTDESEASELILKLERSNNKRRGIVAAMVKDIKERIIERYGEKIPEVIVTGDSSWKPSLMGLAANNISETYHRPVFLWGQEDSVHLKGSCRGVGDVCLHTLMTNASDVFTEYGGHENAGGFATDHERVHNLENRLIEEYKKLKSESPEKIVWIDQELSLGDIANRDTYDKVSLMSPFGEGNKHPIFSITGELCGVKQFGKLNNHFEISISKDGQVFKGISFYSNKDSFLHIPEFGEKVTIVGNLENNIFNGRSEIRMRLIDVIQSL